ncbi:MAG: sugar transferase, partial [Candidatus Acidiferrales bacterium]
MNEAKHRLLLSAFKLFDLGLVVLSFGLATIVVASETGGMSLVEFLSMKVKLSNFVTFAVMLSVWHFIFTLCGLYESRRLAARGSESIDAVKATTLVSICLIVCATLFHIRMITSAFLVLFWIFSCVLVVSGRLLVRNVLGRIRRRGRDLHFILILGTNSRALSFASRIEAKPELGYRVLGFVDDEWEGIAGFLGAGYNFCCNFAGLPEFLRRNVVDEIAFYLPFRSFYEYASDVAALCEQQGIIMRFDPDIFNLRIARPRTEDFDGQPQIAVYAGALEGLPLLVKRMLDLAISFVLLVLLAPLFIVVSVLIKLTSEGPVFFLQQRVGVNKRRFLIYKFRTMVPNAEKMLAELEALNEVSGPVFKIK